MNKFTLQNHSEVTYCHNNVEITHNLTEGMDAYSYTAMLVVTQNAEIPELKERLAMHEREGYKLVPVRCNNKMAHAAKAVDGRLSAFKYGDVWYAMIGASE